MWWNRHKIQNLLVTSLYEPLTAEEQQELDDALAGSAALKAEAEALRDLVDRVPRISPQLDQDLLPALHSKLAEPERTVRSARSRRLARAVAAVALLAVAGGILFWVNEADAPANYDEIIAMSDAQQTWLAQAIQEADQLVAEHRLGEAYELLQKFLSARPNDPRAAEAELRVADLAYDLKRYREALDAHNKLVAPPYEHILDQSEGLRQHIIQRRELLADTAKSDFQPLYDLDAATRDRGNEVARLEQVIVENPETLVADLAAEKMGEVLLAQSEEDTSDVKTAYLRAMEDARSQCTHPYAAALLDLKIGDLYQSDFNDLPAAANHYRKAAQDPVLAKRAGDALGSLEESQ